MNEFERKDIDKAQQVIQLSKVSISFTKEREGQYLIIAGIISGNLSHESRITYRFDASTDGVKLKSHCNCNVWNSEEHCPHVIALTIKYFTEHRPDVDIIF